MAAGNANIYAPTVRSLFTKIHIRRSLTKIDVWAAGHALKNARQALYPC